MNNKNFKYPGMISPDIFYKPSFYKKKKWSYLEAALFFYLKSMFHDATTWYTVNHFTYDIYIPSISTGFKIDEKETVDLPKSKKIKLIRLREEHLPKLDDGSLQIFFKKNEFEEAIKEVFKALQKDIPTIDFKKDVDPIYKEYEVSFSYDGRYHDYIEKRLQAFYKPVSLLKSILRYPIGKEYEKILNGDVKLEELSPWSSLTVWWHCPVCNGYFPASPLDRLRGMGCWHCEGRSVLKGFNDFKTTHPDLVKFYREDNLIPADRRMFDPSESVKWNCVNCGGTAMATFREAEKKHGILYCYSCKKKMAKEGHDFYKIEDTAIKDFIGEEELKKKEAFNEHLQKIIYTPPTNPSSRNFKLKNLMNQYKGDTNDDDNENK